MADNNNDKRVDAFDNNNCIIVSDNEAFIDELRTNNSTDFTIQDCPSIDDLINNPTMLDNNSIVIFDIDSGDQNKAISEVTRLKTADPSQMIFAVGEQQQLSELLRSGLQPLVYRAFNKPIRPKQLFLAFNSAEQQHNDALINPVSTNSISVHSVSVHEDKKGINKLIPIAAAILILIPAAIFLFSGSNEEKQNIATQEDNTINIDEVLSTTTDDSFSPLDESNQQAEQAILEGRLIEPPQDNALYYYDKALEIDPYDSTAYNGRRRLLDLLKQSLNEQLSFNNFDKALAIGNTLQNIDPFNPDNKALFSQIEEAVTAHIQDLGETGDQADIDRTAAILDKLETQGFAKSKAAIDALKIESETLSKIDAALEENILIPPQKGNAFTSISTAIKKNTVTREKLTPKIQQLHLSIVDVIKQNIDTDIAVAQEYGEFLEKLNYNKKQIADIKAEIQEKVAPEEEQETEADIEVAQQDEVEAKPEPAVEEKPVAKIIPAKLISRASPRYPSRAIKKDIEGWVELSFKIDTQGIPSDIKILSAEPEAIFDKSSINAVKKWRFSPARNDQTGQAVEFQIDSTKLHYRLK